MSDREQDSAGMTLGEALRAAAAILAGSGIEDPRREARLLAGHLLGLRPAAVLDPGRLVDGAGLAALARRRAAGEPAAFITGRRGFWTLELEVSPDTLVPRPDTEALVEAALANLPDRARVRRILDLGTGTGCLLLATLCEFPDAFGVGIDISAAAARLARRNAAATGLAARAAFVAGDWDGPLSGRFDLVLCNPPYVATGELAALMPEVRLHEPPRALDGGPDGLDAYRRLMPTLPELLAADGVAILEVGRGQARDVADLAEQAGMTHIVTRPDLAGIGRAVVIGSPKKPFVARGFRG